MIYTLRDLYSLSLLILWFIAYICEFQLGISKNKCMSFPFLFIYFLFSIQHLPLRVCDTSRLKTPNMSPKLCINNLLESIISLGIKNSGDFVVVVLFSFCSCKSVIPFSCRAGILSITFHH